MRRRSVLLAAAALTGPAARAQTRMPMADMHSHYGLIARPLEGSGLAAELREQGVALMAWKLVADMRWLRATPTGIEQAREPAPGELAAFFAEQLARMKAYLAQNRLRTVLTRGDVDSGLADGPGVVLACEGADFLEGRVDALAGAVAQGLRHLQLVHYIKSPIGDLQTQEPRHRGLSDAGALLVEACNAQGVLVDLAHSAGPAVERALQVAKLPVVWSHGWVDQAEGSWQDALGLMQRRLSLAHARRIADKGGVVGLWGLGLPAAAIERVAWRNYARVLTEALKA
jgi:membrane dipeptidase